MIDSLRPLFENHSKKMMILPLLLILVSFIFLVNAQITTGEFLKKDASLSGGMTVTLYTPSPIDHSSLEKILKKSFTEVNIRGLSEFGTSREIGVVIETIEIQEDLMRSSILEATGIEMTNENSSIEVVGSSLGESFYSQMVRGLIFAFLFMSLTVFITFRKFSPSIAVIFAALGDMIVTIAVLNILDIRISSAGIASLLLLIGYSVDTDILLTTRLLKKREGSIIDGIISSIKTGLTMTFTAIGAVLVGYFFSSSLVIKQMFLIIIIGLITDIIMTYMFNAPLLQYYLNKKGEK